MLLTQMLSVLENVSMPEKDYEICDIVYDSRKAYEGCVFVCLCGHTVDGHDYAKSAYERGCRVFIAEKNISLPDDSCIIYIDNTRAALPLISAEFFGHPERHIKLIGITGTKGKTTVTKLTRDILSAGGYNTATIGTNGIYIGDEHYDTVNTTPESFEIFKALDKMVKGNVDVCVIEVSSQAYLTHRVDGITFDIGVFTNLAHDHIGDGEHPDFQNYLDCKAKLFENCRCGIFNSDDKYYTDIRKNAKCTSVTYGIDSHADYTASLIKEYKTDNCLGVSFECSALTGIIPVTLKMPGIFNVYNALAAIAAAKRFAVKDEIITSSLKASTVDGRFEIIDALDFCSVIIDYAHNGFAMQNLLDTVRRYSPRRLIVLFGSVGSRTELRRKELGDVCAKSADFCVLTSDNPDFEDPDNIIADIEKSFIGTSTPYVKITDREEAIRYVIRNACIGDVIILAGKGHEKYQLICGRHVPFDERAIVIEEASLMTKGSK